jgi:hypothetical protein
MRGGDIRDPLTTFHCTSNEYLINIPGAKLSGSAAYWFETRRQECPKESFEQVIDFYSGG